VGFWVHLKGLGLFIMLRQIVIDRGLQVIDAGIAATSDAPRRDLGEEALHEVQPRRAGGREVQLEAGVLCQPGLHVGRLVGGVVVEHQMDIALARHGLVDVVQEFQELLGAMPR